MKNRLIVLFFFLGLALIGYAVSTKTSSAVAQVQVANNDMSDINKALGN